MAPRVEFLARSSSRSTLRRGVIIAALLSVVLLVVWQVSSQNLMLVVLATAPAGAIGILLGRDRLGWRLPDDAAALVSGWDAFNREIDRSRRHERPLALAAASLPKEDVTGHALAETIARARSQMRSIDLVWCHGSRLWVLMPESNRDGGTAAIRRIADAAPATRYAVWRLAVFPDDALTVGELIPALDRSARVDLGMRPIAPRAP